MYTKQIANAIKYLVQLLVNRDFKRVFDEDFLKLISEEEIKEAIDSYGETLTMPLEEIHFYDFDFYFLVDDKETLQIEWMLHSDNKESDLSLVFYFRDYDGDTFSHSLYGIYVQ